MGEIVALIPVLNRPQRVAPVMESFRNAGGSVRVLFIPSPDDDAELEALEAAEAPYLIAPFTSESGGQWARKINHGYRNTNEPWILCAADDLDPRPGWAEAALEHAHPGVGVIGTNDLGNPTVMRGDHSTHPLVARWYADEHGTVDGPGRVVPECYGHQWCDTELVQTAMSRGAWAFAKDSHVAHLHPFWTKGPSDATYERGMASARADQRLFRQRQRLWRGLESVR